MRYSLILLMIVLLTGCCHAQTHTGKTCTEIILETQTGRLYGTLILPPINKKIPVVLFIAGSGPKTVIQINFLP